MVTDIELDGMLEGTSDIEMPDAGEIEGDLELSPANELEGELEVPDSGDSLLGVNVNGVPQPVINRIADISVVTKVSQLDNDADYVTSDVLAETRLEVLNAIDEASSETLNQSREYTDGEINSVEDSVNVLADEIDSVKTLIPTQATEDNKLADKEFVNSSIATNTATFRGTFTNTSNFPQTATNNDYVFLRVVDSVTSLVTRYDRYKWNGTQWEYEYTLNNSSFTAAQWEAINSGATSSLISRLQDFNPEEYLKLTGGTITGDITFQGQPNTHQYIKFFKDDTGLYNFAIRNPYNGGRIEIGRFVRISGDYSEIIRITVAQGNGVVAIPSGELYMGQPSLIENKAQKYSDIYKQGIVSQTQTWTQQTDGSYSYTMSNQVTGNIPIEFIRRWNTVAGKYASASYPRQFNEETGYFEANGLTDISYEEAIMILEESQPLAGQYMPIYNYSRTNFAGTITGCNASRNWQYSLSEIAYQGVISWNSTNMTTQFQGSKYLTTILNWNSRYYSTSFTISDCPSLKNIIFRSNTMGFKINVTITGCPNLTLESVVNMVNSATNGSTAITFKFDQAVYNKCILDMTQYTYGGQTYTGIRNYAAARNISIVSA